MDATSDDAMTATGGNDATTETGGNDATTETGGNDATTETGSNDATTETGGNDATTETGSNDATTETGSNDAATETGSNDAGDARDSAGDASLDADPCLGVTCSSPPAPGCYGAATRETFTAMGSCFEGTCYYGSIYTPCGYGQLCAGSVCVSPSCSLGGDGFSNCGPTGTDNCCASLLVTGVATASFSRSYDGVSSGLTDPKYKAQVSDFKLDKYEITVGRFRQYVAAVLGLDQASAARVGGN
jgi:hypothetical protein